MMMRLLSLLSLSEYTHISDTRDTRYKAKAILILDFNTNTIPDTLSRCTTYELLDIRVGGTP